MNTIFVDLGKQFLIDAIMQSCTNSVLADNSVFNKGLGLVGLQRNAQLAADKRACLESLRRELADYNPGLEIVDSAALEQFIKLLMKHRTTSNQLSKDKGLPEGATGNSLLKAIALIQAIYDQLNIAVNRPTSCKLLNVPKDQEALHIFKYFVAKYFTMKIISQQGLSLMQEVTEQPQISTFRARALEREALITAAINECEDSLSGLKQKHRRCQEWTIRHVTTCIKTLQTQDNDLCARYGSILNATTNLLS